MTTATKIDLKHLLDARAESEEALYRELDLLADRLTLAIPEYEVVLVHNPSTRQDYILVERKEAPSASDWKAIAQQCIAKAERVSAEQVRRLNEPVKEHLIKAIDEERKE